MTRFLNETSGFYEVPDVLRGGFGRITSWLLGYQVNFFREAVMFFFGG